MKPTKWLLGTKWRSIHNSKNNSVTRARQIVWGPPPRCPAGQGPLVVASVCQSVRGLSASELILASPHIHFLAAKAHALGLKPQPLLRRRVSLQFDCTTGSQHPLPGQPEPSTQSRRHLPRRSRKARRSGDSAVSRHFAARDSANCLLDPHTHLASFILFLSARTAPSRPQVVSLRDEPDAPLLRPFVAKETVLSLPKLKQNLRKGVTLPRGMIPAPHIRSRAHRIRSTA